MKFNLLNLSLHWSNNVENDYEILVTDSNFIDLNYSLISNGLIDNIILNIKGLLMYTSLPILNKHSITSSFIDNQHFMVMEWIVANDFKFSDSYIIVPGLECMMSNICHYSCINNKMKNCSILFHDGKF